MKSKIFRSLFLKSVLGRIIYCIVIITCLNNPVQAQAQLVTANLLITPPYSVYFRDYAGYGRTNNMLLSLFSSTARRVYLAGSITKDDNSIVISLKNGYRPVAPILLNANTTLMLNGLQLRKIYGDGTTGDLNLTGLSANDIALNQSLPEGSYTFCIQVKDFDTRELISTACKTIYVTYYDPPQILNPFNGSSVQGFNPQMLMVTWQNTAPQVFGVTYRLKIVKLVKGITPVDAINNNVQLILDKGNLFTTNYPIDISSGIKLEAGQIYCMQVSAQSPTAYFKNRGKSEVTTFYYNGERTFDISKVSLNFLNPVAYKGADTIVVNNDKSFMLSWHLFEGANTGDTVRNIIVSDSVNKKYNLSRYVVKVKPAKSSSKATDRTFNYTTQVVADNNGLIHNNINYSEENADNAGFKDGYWYSATVTAYNKENQVIAENSSVDFQYKKLKDDEVYLNTSVHAVIKYGFKGFSELYNAANTPVEVEALQIINGVSDKPIIKVGNRNYVSLAKASANTQANGEVQVKLGIPVQSIKDDSIYYRVVMDGAYYIDQDFKWLATSGPKKDNVVRNDTGYLNFGQLVAKTYGYSLKVNVTKAFTSYRINNKDGTLDIKLADNKKNLDYLQTDSGMVYRAGISKPMAGITIALYRKAKKSYIPPVEGNLASSSGDFYGDVEVARAITTITSDGKGHDTSFVKFDRLLSNIFNGDEYYVIALGGNGKNPPPVQFSPGGGKTSFTYLNAYAKQAYKDNGFVASEAVFKLQKPLNTNNDDSLYRSVSFNYEITSTRPPTSIVKGRLLYQWKSDNNHLVRPLAKSSFKIIVDYLVNGKPIGYTTKFEKKTYEQKFFVPQGNATYADGMELLDFGKTMGTGTTDDQGNFQIETINLNPKGSLGKGYVVSKGWTVPPEKQLQAVVTGPESVITNHMATVFDPGVTNNGIFGNIASGGSAAIQQTVNQAANQQGFLNQGMSVVMDNTGAFLVSNVAKTNLKGANLQNGAIQAGHGPNNEEDKPAIDGDDDLVDFQRVYRIVPDNPYIYPAKETAVVQPFEATDVITFNGLVKEVKVKVSAKCNTNTVTQADILIFRSLADKTKDLPLGEGDGNYAQKLLINSEYSGNNGDVQNASRLDRNNIFNTKFEYLLPFAPVNGSGEAMFSTLLAGYGNYYVEAFSGTDGQPTEFYQATFQSIDTKIDDNNPALWDGSASPDPVTVNVSLKTLDSRAFFRLLDNSTKSMIPYGKIRAYNPIGFGVPSRTVIADDQGYAELKVTLAPLKSYITKNGDSVSFRGEANGYNPSAHAGFPFNLQGIQFIHNFLLDPSGSISGHLVSADEKEGGYIRTPSGYFFVQFKSVQKNVVGYIRTGSGMVFPTDSRGYFTIPSAAVAGNKIEIIPKDVAYFDTSYTMTVADASRKVIDLNDISIYRRKHRIHFVINDGDNGAPLQNASVTLQEISMNTKNGIADFVFENVSVNNYSFIIRGPEGKNYIPIVKNVKNEETKDFVTIYVSLEKGSEITGKVLLDGSPVKNAKVYIDADAKVQQASGAAKPQGQIADNANLVLAYTDASGNYVLHGVPVNNQTIDLLATLDTSFAVNGDRQKVSIINKQGTTDFSLGGFRDLVINNLHGFPLTVEKITATSNKDEVKVSGLLHWKESISNFSLNEVDKVIRVEDVLYKNTTTPNGKVGIAQEASVTLQGTVTIKLKYLDKYNVLLSGPITSMEDVLIPKPLVITKENDLGIIKGKVHIVDNSFNYPSSYLKFQDQDFFFAEKTNGAVSTILSAVKSAVTISDASSGNYRTLNDLEKKVEQVRQGYTTVNASTVPDYNLSNSSGGNLQFSFIGFTAIADALTSYMDKLGKIHLNIDMACHIKNAQPENISVKLNNVVLDENKVYPATNAAPIEVALEAWKLSIRNWSISPEQGGIVSKDGLIRTAKLDIPFNSFLLRNDLFDIDKFNYSGLQLGGGIVTLSDIKQGGAGLVFDNKTGSDLAPHWRFSISGTGGPVATIKNLPGLNGIIGIEYIQILSNNESVFQLRQTSDVLQVNNNPMTKFSPKVLTNGVDFFNIAGELNINAPRLSDMLLVLNYTKPSVALVMKLQNVSTDFEGKGFVHFTSVDGVNDQSNVVINNSQIIISGQVEEKPSKSFNPVPAIFTATNGAVPDFKVDLQKNYVMQLTSESNGASTGGYRLTIALGGMYVNNGDWGTLSYEGIMASNSRSDKGVKDTYTKFNVLGDVSVSADKVEMENTTPFGKLTLIFDFPDKRLIGKLELDHVQLGTNTISGTVETLFDPEGFYVAGGGSAEINIGNPIADGTYNLGFMIGSYPLHSANEELWKVVTAYKQPEVKNDCFVQKLKGKLAGFYMSVDRMIFDVDYDFDFVIVSGYVNGKALVGVDMWANFSGETTLGVAVKVYAHAAAGMSAITGTSISGDITALAAIKLAYEQNKFVVQGSIDMSFGVTIHQELLVTSVSTSASVGCSAQGGTEGFSFKLTSGGPISACY